MDHHGEARTLRKEHCEGVERGKVKFNGGEGDRSRRERTRIFLEVAFKGKKVMLSLHAWQRRSNGKRRITYYRVTFTKLSWTHSVPRLSQRGYKFSDSGRSLSIAVHSSWLAISDHIEKEASKKASSLCPRF